MTDREDTIQVLYGKEATWLDKDLTLQRGEHGFEWDTDRFKIGDGSTKYSELDYYIPESKIKELIAQAVAQLPAGGGSALVALQAHIVSPTPHPAYDEMPSLVSRYRSRKV